MNTARIKFLNFLLGQCRFLMESHDREMAAEAAAKHAALSQELAEVMEEERPSFKAA